MASLGTNVMPSNEWTPSRAAVLRTSTVEAPLLLVLGSHRDAPTDWLQAGAALESVLLHASAQGLTATFLNEPLHHPLLRDGLRALVFASGAPQAIVRFDFDASSALLDLRDAREVTVA